MIRVVFLTVVIPYDGHPTGGTICSENHIKRLHQDGNIDLFVVVVGSESARPKITGFLSSLGVRHEYLTLRPYPPESLPFFKFIYARLLGFGWDLRSISCQEVRPAILQCIQRRSPDIVLLEYLYTALFVDMDALDALAVPFVTITLNREDELFEEMCRQGGRFTLRQRIATQRLAHFERAVYCRSAHVIAIGEPDLPKCIRPELSTCITPYLDTKGPNRWRFTRSRTIFFVGNIGHHPNRIAVRFMEAIAPLVARMQPALSIKIVGADHALSPNPSPNISYLGLADANTVDRLFRDGDLMLCPLNNDFGMKFKVAEAVSYGTPLIASRQTALCVPYLRNILPSFSLSDIPAAAKAIVDLAESEKALIDLSDRIARASAEFITSQGNIWSETLGGILSRHSKAIGRPGSCHKCEVDP